MHTLSSVDINGGTRHTLIIDEHKLLHPISLAVFEVNVISGRFCPLLVWESWHLMGAFPWCINGYQLTYFK